MKLHHARLLLFALNLFAAALPRWGIAQQSIPPAAKHRMNVMEAYACSLNVWNMETQEGRHERKLSEFRLVLQAHYRGVALQERKPETLSETYGSFHLKQLELKYFKNWDNAQSAKAPEEISASVDWDKVKVHEEEATVPLRSLSPEKKLRRVTLHSKLAMASNDLMRLGAFEFVPEQAGVYEIHYQLLHKNRVQSEKREVLEVHCPEVRLRLAVLKAGVLHQVRMPYIQIPLVASTFFEHGSEQWNQNATDRIFRSVFWGLTAKRLACNSLTAQLLLLDDPTSNLGSPAQFELTHRRALTLLQLFKEKKISFRSGIPCAGLLSERNGHAPVDSCASNIALEPPWGSQSEVFIKASGSEISPEWFAQENRVVPLVASLEAQRVIFQPLKLRPLEESDDIELRCEQGLPLALVHCVRYAMIEVANAGGETKRQEVSLENLQAASRGERSLRLDSEEMREFLRQGTFSARLLLQTSFADSLIAGEPARFTITRRNIVRDEVFALSPYDRTDLIYALDHERLASLSHEILRTVRDSLSAKSSEIFVLITGHSDSLGEHRPNGVGRDYNLGLSFSRAIYLRKLLTDSLLAAAAKSGLSARPGNELWHIPAALRERVIKSVKNNVIQEVFKKPNCAGASSECSDEILQSHLEMLITEKVRHFKAGMTQEILRLEGVPSAENIRVNIAALRTLLPVEAVTIEFAGATQPPRSVHFISTGLGAAVPFYRRLEVSEELQEVFCRMGFKPEEHPEFFFGTDAYPAGRLMNRRVELNVVW